MDGVPVGAGLGEDKLVLIFSLTRLKTLGIILMCCNSAL